MGKRIHILGPSGSGTTTVGAQLSSELGIEHLDTDSFYWKKTSVAFTERYPIADRIMAIGEATEGVEDWVLSGSLCSWGTPLAEWFTHVVYLWVPWEIRRERLLVREEERYGALALEPGGEMFEVNRDFMEWASQYDTAGVEQRSRRMHERWLGELASGTQIIRIEGEMGVGDIVRSVLSCV